MGSPPGARAQAASKSPSPAHRTKQGAGRVPHRYTIHTTASGSRLPAAHSSPVRRAHAPPTAPRPVNAGVRPGRPWGKIPTQARARDASSDHVHRGPSGNFAPISARIRIGQGARSTVHHSGEYRISSTLKRSQSRSAATPARESSLEGSPLLRLSASAAPPGRRKTSNARTRARKHRAGAHNGQCANAPAWGTHPLRETRLSPTTTQRTALAPERPRIVALRNTPPTFRIRTRKDPQHASPAGENTRPLKAMLTAQPTTRKAPHETATANVPCPSVPSHESRPQREPRCAARHPSSHNGTLWWPAANCKIPKAESRTKRIPNGKPETRVV